MTTYTPGGVVCMGQTPANVVERLTIAARRASEARVDDVRAEVDAARSAARGSLDRDDAVLAGTLLAVAYLNGGMFTDARRELDVVRPLLPNTSPVRQARFSIIDSHLKHTHGDDDQAIKGLITALATLGADPEPSEELALVLGNCSISLASVQLFALSVETGQTAINAALAANIRPARFQFQTGYAYLQWAVRILHLRETAEAREHFRSAAAMLEVALRDAPDLGPLFTALGHSYLSLCYSRLGQPDAARAMVAAGRAIPTAWSYVSARMLAHAEGASLIASGWYAQAAELLEDTWRDAIRQPKAALVEDIAFLLAEAAEAVGDLREALRWYSEVHRRYGRAEYAVANARADAAQLRVAQEGLLQRSRQLEWDSRADPLTGVANRRAMDEALARRFTQSWPTEQPLSVIVVDVDHFKAINDDRGHLVGDEVLRQVARLLRQQVREGDLCARYGGDEFVLVLTADENSSRAVAQRAAADIARYPWPTVAGGLNVTVTCGVAQRRAEHTPHTLFSTADGDLLAAKRARGRPQTAAAM
jgi:diguanylate cyclase (GGDEF)-like protein